MAGTGHATNGYNHYSIMKRLNMDFLEQQRRRTQHKLRWVVALLVAYRTGGSVLMGALPVAMDLMTVSVKALQIFSSFSSSSPPRPPDNNLLYEVLCEGENADAFSFLFCIFVLGLALAFYSMFNVLQEN